MVSAPRAVAQTYPGKPIHFIVGQTVGGASDLFARMIGQKLYEAWKQPVVVDSRPGAAGSIGAELTARSAPDGYTLLLAYHQHTVNAALNSKLPYDPVDSFTPITQLTAAGLMLVVNPSTPVKNLKEFVEWTKNFKGALNFGSAGIGSGGHLAGELYNLMAHVKAQHIPYKGAGPSFIELIAGQYQYNFGGLAGAVVHVRSGKLRGLAVTTPKRVAEFPDLPAMAEVLPGFEIVGWYGVLAPAKLPKPLVTRLHDEFVKVLKQPDVNEKIVLTGAEAVGNTPEEFRNYLHVDVAKWAKLFKESGAKLY